ncbi:hypothetical protein [Aurantibacillus circumpalustris]|uniref:hypothetical protein n=1 Tax=Aurantibacillus circumpalustris TaxID=3036359 RepID=UPI00295C3774|nr:hypothetical protein [Aurantibacillus circumpalustris]
MENNRFGHISQKELDSLLNEAFLNLDFENNSKNKEVLAIVTKQTMSKKPHSTFIYARWLNLGFFLLSFFVCVNSFYRHIDPLFDMISKEENSDPMMKTEEQKKLMFRLPTTTYSVKNAPADQLENRSASPKFANRHSVKNKFQVVNKKNRKKALATTLSKRNSTDSILKYEVSDSEAKNMNMPLTIANVDSLDTISQKKTTASVLVSNSNQSKSSKRVKPIQPENKTKVAKRKKGKLFFRNGTFKLRKGKYGKSR